MQPVAAATDPEVPTGPDAGDDGVTGPGARRTETNRAPVPHRYEGGVVMDTVLLLLIACAAYWWSNW